MKKAAVPPDFSSRFEDGSILMRLPSARGGACAPPAATSLRLTRMGSCRSGGETHWFVSLTLSMLLGLAVTAYLVRSVNFKLFFAAQPVTQADRARLVRHLVSSEHPPALDHWGRVAHRCPAGVALAPRCEKALAISRSRRSGPTVAGSRRTPR